MFDMYRVKKKRALDPNAPPRPNLLNHEKRIKETTGSVAEIQQQNQELKQRVTELERKLNNQTAYLNTLHQYVHQKLRG
jgi:predicted RNase H-like nuclease (RuvC/YqgF family)